MAKPRHKHNWQWDRTIRLLVCANGCGKEYKGPSRAQTEARRKNFHKMFVLGGLARAKANVAVAHSLDSIQTRVAIEAIDILIEEARATL